MKYVIALDGPVGAGKSSVADDVARKLGILHLDTGAMYRALALKAQREGIAVDDVEKLTALAQTSMPQVRFENGSQHTYLGDEDVTGLIRTPEISMATSTISKVPGVRRAMVDAQRTLAKRTDMLMDGRDIGTVVLKDDATIKIYLTASAEERARRRFTELQSKGNSSTYEEVLEDVIRRDLQDSTREVDPLKPAEDAQILDSTELTQEQVVDEIIRRVNLKMGIKPKKAEKLTFLYKVGRAVANLLFHTLMPVTYHHVERAQMDAPYLLLGNHNCLLDPLVIGSPVYRYHVRFLGKKELVKYKPLKWLFDQLLMIPVDRHNMDMAAVRTCLKTLKEGHVLGIFPEGTRHKEGVMQDIESGVALIALRSGARLLPAYISDKPQFFHRIHVYFGEPISSKAFAKDGIQKESCDRLMAHITQAYADLVAEHAQTSKKPQK